MRKHPGKVENLKHFNAKPPQSASPTVQEIFNLADSLGETGKALGLKTKTTHVTISRWRHGKACPTVVDMEELLHALKHRMVIIPEGCEFMLIPKKRVA
ncbi:hypothetical protein [Aminobacter phage Erebus]|nr:hypothetical protein [Aminobacter phage Erebus]